MPTNIVPPWDQLPDNLTWKEKVAYLAHQFLTMEQTACPVTHRFEQGLYILEMRIPAETLFIGRVHRHGHVCQLLEGSVILIHNEDHREAFKAPSEIMTKPRYQMVVYEVTDVLAQTIHPNPSGEHDYSVLESDIFEPVYDLRAMGQKIHARLAYSNMLADFNLDEVSLKPLIEDESDQIPFSQDYPVYVAPSDIDGLGILAKRDIAKGERIAPARINGKRTPAGRYTNHSFSPTACMSGKGDLDLVALTDISRGAEISVDYRHSLIMGIAT
jgi:hypothetical protein